MDAMDAMEETAMTQSGATRPHIEGVHHFSPTVTDLDRSIDWYQQVFGLERVPGIFPHYGREQTGYAVLLTDPHSGLAFGLHHHEANRGEPFDESRTGLDHISFPVSSRADLDAWSAWLGSLGVRHDVNHVDEPFSHTTLVFRDPDNIQLELFIMGG